MKTPPETPPGGGPPAATQSGRTPRLLGWILNAGYCFALLVLSPVIAWRAWRTGKYREGLREKLLGVAPLRQSGNPCLWLHAVSVGEVNVAATLAGEVARRHAGWDVVISATTKTGYELARSRHGDRRSVFYCPLDFTWATDRAVRRVRPDLLVLMELELWPNLIASAKRRGACVAIANGRLSESSFRGYRRAGWLSRRVLGMIDVVAAQDAETAERFVALGAPRVAATGALKYDGAETDRDNAKTTGLRRLAGLAEDATVWLAGSTQAPEEEIVLRVFGRLVSDFPNLRLILVPRHPERFNDVEGLLRECDAPHVRRSRLGRPGVPALESVLLVDTVGELGAWWGVADIAFVGGSFGDRGGQNMIEPAAYGAAVCFGPNTRNFRDIVAKLKRADACREVAGEGELESFVRRCLTQRGFAAGLGERARRLVASQLGATARTIDLVAELMDRRRAPHPPQEAPPPGGRPTLRARWVSR